MGYAGARTKEIATEAGINETIIYRHFASKQDLFDAAVIEPLEQWMSDYHHLGGLVARTSEPETQLELITRTSTEYFRQVNSILPLLGIALFGRDELGADFYVQRIVPVVDRWTELTRKSLAPDSRGARFDAHFLALAGLGMTFFFSADAHFRGEPMDEARLGRQMAELLLPIYERPH